MMQNLRLLSQYKDSISHLYFEYGQIEVTDGVAVFRDRDGTFPIPSNTVAVIMLGPGTTVTHAAVKVLSESGCLIEWTGDGATKFYAFGHGKTHSSKNALKQVEAWANIEKRNKVIQHMYSRRFGEKLPPGLSINQIRGKEGIRLREVYERESVEKGILWKGKIGGDSSGQIPDMVNQTLSLTNSYLYGMCHAAILSSGYLPSIGFIHIGNARSFVFDIADYYKVEVSIPLAFSLAQRPEARLDVQARRLLRNKILELKLMTRIIQDLNETFISVS